MIRRTSLLIGLAVVVATVHAAEADKVRVFPLAGMPDPGVNGKLTKALADSIDAEVANVPIEDAAGLLECDPESSACLTAVAKSVSADRLVFGTITIVEDDKLKVTLTRFNPAGPDRQQRTFVIRGEGADELATDLVRASGPLFGRQDKPPDIVDDKGDDTPDLGPKRRPGKVSVATWAIAGGGIAAIGGGVAFLLSAQNLRAAVDNAPRNTPDDFAKLRALEDKGVLRTRIGDVLVVAGGIAVAVAVVRGVLEHRSTEATVVQPVPIDGGAAIVLTVTR